MFLFSLFTTQTPYIILLIGYLFYFGSYTVVKNKDLYLDNSEEAKDITYRPAAQNYSHLTVNFAKPDKNAIFQYPQLKAAHHIVVKETLKNYPLFSRNFISQYFQSSTFCRPPPVS